jgi:hypothetical protein
MNFVIYWDAGASAQIELFRSGKSEDGDISIQMKFTSPFRQAVRPSPIDVSLGTDDVRPINEELQKLKCSPSLREDRRRQAPKGQIRLCCCARISATCCIIW